MLTETTETTVTFLRASETRPIPGWDGWVLYKILQVVDKSQVLFSGWARETELNEFMNSSRSEFKPDHSLEPLVGISPEWVSECPRRQLVALRPGSLGQRFDDILSERVKDPWEQPALFCGVSGWDHSVVDGQGNHLPVGRWFDRFGGGGYYAGKYDMPKLEKILDGRDDIRFERDGFYWAPSEELARELGGLSSDDFQKACFDRDVFGLRAGGAALFEDYHSENYIPEDDCYGRAARKLAYHLV